MSKQFVKCRDCGSYVFIGQECYEHKGAIFCNEKCARAYWDYITEDFMYFEEPFEKGKVIILGSKE